MRSFGLFILLLGAGCSKVPESAPLPAPRTPATIEVPECISVAGVVPGNPLGLPAPDPAFRAAAREAYVEFAGRLDVDAFLASYAGIARSLRIGTRKECMDAVRMCGASRDLRAIPLLVRELAVQDHEHQVWAGYALEQVINNHELERRDQQRLEEVYLLPRTEGCTDLRPMYWVLEEMMRSGESSLEAYAASMAGYLGLEQLRPLMEALRSSRPTAYFENALAQLDRTPTR